MEYVQPPVSTIDSSQSPLALLAQTCNSIGKDSPSSRLQPSLAALDEFRCRSPLSDTRDSPPTSPERELKPAKRASTSPREDRRKNAKSNEKSEKAEIPKTSSPTPGAMSADRRSTVSATSSFNPGVINPAIFAASPMMDPTAALASLQAYQAAIAAQSLSPAAGTLPGLSSHMTVNPMLSPYLMYQHQMRLANHVTSGVCRDPLCGICQLQKTGSCPAGCSQCNHEKNGLMSRMPAAHGDSGRHDAAFPYPCNWLSGTDFCGKRFATIEELIAHVRSHTTASEATLAASLPASSQLGIPSPFSPALTGATPHKHLSEASASLAMLRHHPYKSTLPASPFSSISPYARSPYNLLGSRLGTTAVP